MTFEEIKTMVESVGLPYTYYQWPVKEAPAPPYLIFYYPGRDDDAADNVNYGLITNLMIELYTDEKDFASEAAVESVLTANKMFFDKTESYITSERMYEVLYEMEVTINAN